MTAADYRCLFPQKGDVLLIWLDKPKNTRVSSFFTLHWVLMIFLCWKHRGRAPAVMSGKILRFEEDYAESLAVQLVSAPQQAADISCCQETSMEPWCTNGKHPPVLHGIMFLNFITEIVPVLTLRSLRHCPCVCVCVCVCESYWKNDLKVTVAHVRMCRLLRQHQSSPKLNPTWICSFTRMNVQWAGGEYSPLLILCMCDSDTTFRMEMENWASREK